MMASQKINVSCDRASSLLLDNFLYGAAGWGFCSYAANYLEILMDLLADDLKFDLEKLGRNSTVLKTRSLSVSVIYTL